MATKKEKKLRTRGAALYRAWKEVLEVTQVEIKHIKRDLKKHQSDLTHLRKVQKRLRQLQREASLLVQLRCLGKAMSFDAWHKRHVLHPISEPTHGDEETCDQCKGKVAV